MVSVEPLKEHDFKLSVSPTLFQHDIHLLLHVREARQVELHLIDPYGRTLHTKRWKCYKGDNQLEWRNLPGLSKSVYFIVARSGTDFQVSKIIRN